MSYVTKLTSITIDSTALIVMSLQLRLLRTSDLYY